MQIKHVGDRKTCKKQSILFKPYQAFSAKFGKHFKSIWHIHLVFLSTFCILTVVIHCTVSNLDTLFIIWTWSQFYPFLISIAYFTFSHSVSLLRSLFQITLWIFKMILNKYMYTCQQEIDERGIIQDFSRYKHLNILYTEKLTETKTEFLL